MFFAQGVFVFLVVVGGVAVFAQTPDVAVSAGRAAI
jgi:hypothetical protein